MATPGDDAGAGLVRCELCHKPATGFAFIEDNRYCHGDNDPRPTCYERALMPLDVAQREGLL